MVIDSFLDVKSWVERTPDVEACRPGRCAGCGAAGRPVGGRLVLVGHGLRSRQVRGPLAPDARAGVYVLWVRRYRCRTCRATLTVIPRGAVRARHFSATAIALAFAMYGLSGASLGATRARVAPWRSAEPGWPSMHRWLDAIARGTLFSGIRRWPPGWSRRRQAERVAASVLAMAPTGGPLEVRIFAGAGRLSCA